MCLKFLPSVLFDTFWWFFESPVYVPGPVTEFWHNNHTLSNYFLMRRQKHYIIDYLDREIGEYWNETRLKIFCDFFPHIPRININRGAFRKRHNGAKKRPGPNHVLYFEMKSDLVDWVIGVKSQVYTVTQDMILLKWNKIYWGFYGTTWSSGYLERGWLNLFMNWHPLLTTRTSQVIKRVRAEVTE